MKRLVEYFKYQNYLTPEQHGYRKRHSTITGTLQMANGIYRAFDNGTCAEISTLDLSKAFDSVSYDILLDKLEYYAVTGQSLNLVRSFLNDKLQLSE